MFQGQMRKAIPSQSIFAVVNPAMCKEEDSGTKKKTQKTKAKDGI
jgi:hypothetical protein